MINNNHIKEKAFLGSGWAFPVSFTKGNYQLKLSKYEENINQTIKIILNTSFGERAFEPQMNGGLQQFMFKDINANLIGEIKDTVKKSLLNNEPRITILGVEVIKKDTKSGLIEVYIDYKYNETNTRHNYVYPFYLKEGTNLKGK